MGQFVGAIEGMGEACRALDYPVVSGNVSLYNETNGQGILPTPTIGGVGLLPEVDKSVGIGFTAPGQALILIGPEGSWLGQSLYLWELFGRAEGAPPPVDLAAERRNGDFVRGLIRAGRVAACHDVSDGGLLVAVAEMAMASGIGVEISAEGPHPHAALFGEDQGRYVLAVAEADAEPILAAARAAEVPARRLGASGGDAVGVSGKGAVKLADLTAAHQGWFPAFMG
jgi:phosphoribosylformylglycinamidine synthase